MGYHLENMFGCCCFLWVLIRKFVPWGQVEDDWGDQDIAAIIQQEGWTKLFLYYSRKSRPRRDWTYKDESIYCMFSFLALMFAS